MFIYVNFGFIVREKKIVLVLGRLDIFCHSLHEHLCWFPFSNIMELCFYMIVLPYPEVGYVDVRLDVLIAVANFLGIPVIA